MAVITALALTALMVSAGIAVDFGNMVAKRGKLQAIAVAASITTAREVAIANAIAAHLDAIARSIVSLKTELSGADVTVSVNVDQTASYVHVAISQGWTPFFAHLVSNAVTPISASATAQNLGTANVCVLGLGATAPNFRVYQGNYYRIERPDTRNFGGHPVL